MAINIKALRDQRVAKAAEARNLLDTNTGDKWSKDIEKQVDAIYEEIDRIDAQITRAEKQAKIDGDKANDDAALEVGERVRAGMTTEQREQHDRYSAAFKSFLIRGERGLTSEEADLLRKGRPQASQSGQQSNGSAGGYLVPTDFGSTLLEALKSFGGMRSVANVIQTSGGNPFPWPTVDETAQEGEIVPENTAATTQDVTFGTTQIGAYKFSSKVFTVPIELLMDQGPGMDVEGYIRKAASTRIARAQNRYYTVGTGTAQPRGVVTAAAAGKIGATGQTTTVLPDDIIDLIHAVDPAYRGMPDVGFMFHDTTLRTLKKIKDTQGRPLWLPGDYSKKEPDTFNAYPYTINQHMPVMAANAKSMLFGHFGDYMIRDVLEVTLFRFDDSAFMTKGQIGFLAWARGDGNLMSAGSPVAYYQNSAS